MTFSKAANPAIQYVWNSKNNCKIGCNKYTKFSLTRKYHTKCNGAEEKIKGNILVFKQRTRGETS